MNSNQEKFTKTRSNNMNKSEKSFTKDDFSLSELTDMKKIWENRNKDGDYEVAMKKSLTFSQEELTKISKRLPWSAMLHYVVHGHHAGIVYQLVVFNYEIDYGEPLLNASMRHSTPVSWKKWKRQLIDQEFRFDAVIEEFAKSLQDSKRFERILDFFGIYPVFDDRELIEQAASPAGRKFAKEIELELRKCRDYDELGHTLDWDSSLRKFIRAKMDEEFGSKRNDGSFWKKHPKLSKILHLQR